MPFNPFSKAKQALQGMESNMMGEKWIAEVKDESGGWKNLEGWQEQYEPKKPKKEGESSSSSPFKPPAGKEESEFAKNAREAAIDKGVAMFQENLVYALMNVMLEASSKVLGTSHDIASKDTSHPQQIKDVVPFMAALNTVLLSFRFDKTGTGTTNKFRFIRREACGDMAAVALQLASSPDDFAEKVNAIFSEDQKPIMRAVLIDEMDAMIKEKADSIEADDEKLAKLKEFLGEGQDNMILQFLSFVAVSKMDVVRIHLQAILDEFFKTLNGELGGEQKSKEELQEGMLVFVEEKYNKAKDTLNNEVGHYTEMIKGMIKSGGPSMSVEEANAAS